MVCLLLDRLRIQVEEAKAKTERLMDAVQAAGGTYFLRKGLAAGSLII